MKGRGVGSAKLRSIFPVILMMLLFFHLCILYYTLHFLAALALTIFSVALQLVCHQLSFSDSPLANFECLGGRPIPLRFCCAFTTHAALRIVRLLWVRFERAIGHCRCATHANENTFIRCICKKNCVSNELQLKYRIYHIVASSACPRHGHHLHHQLPPALRTCLGQDQSGCRSTCNNNVHVSLRLPCVCKLLDLLTSTDARAHNFRSNVHGPLTNAEWTSPPFSIKNQVKTLSISASLHERVGIWISYLTAAQTYKLHSLDLEHLIVERCPLSATLQRIRINIPLCRVEWCRAGP
jgi:hypothetical protein